MAAMAAALMSGLFGGIDLALAQGDPEAGERVFRQCQACHVVDAEQNRVGPHLVGIFGREAGAVEGFNYSDAMAGSGIVWDEETIAAYLADPRGYIPGNRMAFAGLRQDQQIQDVIAYMKSKQ
jgi:cytochrome c